MQFDCSPLGGCARKFPLRGIPEGAGWFQNKTNFNQNP